MFGAPRISLQNLAALCRRLAMATTAGIDVRTVWRNESQRGPAALRAIAGKIHEAVAAGGSLADVIEPLDFFPRLFRQIVSIGEQTGNLAEVYRRLADHYEYQISVRRTFLASLAWPVIQLVAAICIIGGAILVLGIIVPDRPGRERFDPLGLGLFGWRGLAIYLSVVAVIAAGVGLCIRAVMRGALWARPLQRAALGVPILGNCLRTLALSRIAWTLQLAMNSALDVQKTLRLALETSGNDYFASQADAVTADLGAGREIHEALRRTHRFPSEFLDAVEVAEHSGQLVESLERLSRQYEEQAQSAMGVLSKIAAFLIWAMVAGLITIAIFRMAGAYFTQISDIGKGKF